MYFSKPSLFTTREGDALKALQDAMVEQNGLHNAGIIVSPATGRLTLFMYYPVFDEDEKSVIDYVGGGTIADELKELLDTSYVSTDTTMLYSMIMQITAHIFLMRTNHSSQVR